MRLSLPPSFDRGQDATAGRSQNNPRRHHAERNSGAHDGDARALIRWWVISFYEPIAVPWDVIYSTRRYRCGNRDDFATMVLTSGRAADTFGPFLRMYRLIRRVKSPIST
jgi:hypothetical protein